MDAFTLRDAVLSLPALKDFCRRERLTVRFGENWPDYWQVSVTRGGVEYIGNGPTLIDAIEGLETMLYFDGELRV